MGLDVTDECSDCRRRARNREARRRNPPEAPAIAAAVRRMLVGLTRREGDEWALVELHGLAAEVDAALGVAAREMAARSSWGDVGKTLGMTRQGARQRWAAKDSTEVDA